MTKHLGREEYVGFGIQSTTSSVAPQIWFRQLKNSFKPVVNKKQNVSAMGRPEKVNSSVVTSMWSAGGVEGKLQDLSIGYLFYSLAGGVTTTDNADSNAAVKDHAFPMVVGVDKYLTVGVKNPTDDRRYASAQVSQIEITSDAGEEGDWVTFTSDMVAGPKADASNDPGFTDENEFISAHVTAKLASNLAGIAAAPVLETKNVRITISRPRKPFVPHGSKVPTANDTEPVEVTGELTLRYKDTDLEDLWYANTVRALEIKIENSDVTIGAAAHPGLKLVMPQVTLDSFDKTDDLDSYIEQTVTFYAELGPEGYAILPTLTNTQAAYAAA